MEASLLTLIRLERQCVNENVSSMLNENVADEISSEAGLSWRHGKEKPKGSTMPGLMTLPYDEMDGMLRTDSRC